MGKLHDGAGVSELRVERFTARRAALAVHRAVWHVWKWGGRCAYLCSERQSRCFCCARHECWVHSEQSVGGVSPK